MSDEKIGRSTHRTRLALIVADKILDHLWSRFAISPLAGLEREEQRQSVAHEILDGFLEIYGDYIEVAVQGALMLDALVKVPAQFDKLSRAIRATKT